MGRWCVGSGRAEGLVDGGPNGRVGGRAWWAGHGA